MANAISRKINDSLQRPPEEGGFAAGLVGLIGVPMALLSGALVSRSWSEFGVFLALVGAGCAVGGLIGFVLAAPGAPGGEAGAQEAARLGWGARLSVFGNWAAGGAFALALANARDIWAWFASLTDTVSQGSGERGDILYRYLVGSWMIVAVITGFAVGFMQMATNGRLLFSRSDRLFGAPGAAPAAPAAPLTAPSAAEPTQTPAAAPNGVPIDPAYN